jgi:hypothetical protein
MLILVESTRLIFFLKFPEKFCCFFHQKNGKFLEICLFLAGWFFLNLFIYLFLFFKLGGLAIIQKRNEPKLAKGPTVK